MKKIIAFSGSNSSKSINQQLVNAAASMIEGAKVEVIDIRDYPAGIYGIDEEENNGFPSNMVALKEKLKEADGYLISTPEHNGFIPAVLKNIIDWLSRIERKVFDNRPTVFLSTSPGGRGGMTALGQLLSSMPHQGAQVIGGHSMGNFYDKMENGQLIEGEDKEKIAELVKQLIEAL